MPDSPNPQRAELEAKIHEAMEAAHGNSTVAAAMLGVDKEDLWNAIKNFPSLRERWFTNEKRGGLPGSPEIIHRPLESDKALARAIAKEDRMVAAGLKDMGLSDEASKLAMALQKFQGQHYKRALEMLGGGITKQFLDVMVEIQAITHRLSNEIGLSPQQEAMLREDRSRLLAVMNAFYDRANKAALTQAVIKNKLGAGKGGSKAKPGFTPLVMKVEGDVHVTEPKPTEEEHEPVGQGA